MVRRRKATTVNGPDSEENDVIDSHDDENLCASRHPNEIDVMDSSFLKKYIYSD